MNQKIITRVLAAAGAAIALLEFVSTARAQVWTEVGNAGELPATAQVTAGIGPLTAIVGAIDSLTDTDMYCIYIDDPFRFSASTLGTNGTLVDTQLFLFNENGLGIVANDDVDSTTAKGLRSEIPTGVPKLAPGTYYLAISAYDRDPLSASGFIFDNTKSTEIKLPTGPGAGDPVNRWSNTGFETGTYRIELTGTTFCVVPEPATLTLLFIGSLGFVVHGRRSGKRTAGSNRA